MCIFCHMWTHRCKGDSCVKDLILAEKETCLLGSGPLCLLPHASTK